MSEPRVLLVGPYERDNVGDELFLLVTERHLAGAQVVAAAPFAADARELIDRRVPAYGPLLREERFDAIWTVGGQVGVLDLERAYRMAASADTWAALRTAGVGKRLELLRTAVEGEALPVAPYMPSPLAFDVNAGTPSVVNSAGVSGIRHADAARQAELLGLLRGTDDVVVRDPASSQLLERHGIGHELAPDAVHALGVQWPGERDPSSDVAVVQVSTSICKDLGHERLADALVRAGAGAPAGGHGGAGAPADGRGGGAAGPGGRSGGPERGLAGLRIRFVPAGLATGHDALADYDQLAAALRKRAPGVDVSTFEPRRPAAIVERVRTARVVVCTSLHMRIVAAAYGVPRVSLQRFKPTRYAKRWDPDMPFGVELDGLPQAVTDALVAGEDPAVAARSAALAERADADLAALAARVLERATAETDATRAARAERRRAHQLAVLTAQNAHHRAELDALRAEVERLRAPRRRVRVAAARVLRRT